MEPPRTAPPDPDRIDGRSGAASVCLHPIPVLKKRADFLAAARARRQAMPGLVLQARKRREDEAGDGVRVGFTCSKKVGNAVARNRAKRRLREVARTVLPDAGVPGWDYVLIGRRDETAARDFERLKGDLVTALAKIHARP